MSEHLGCHIFAVLGVMYVAQICYNIFAGFRDAMKETKK